MTEPTESKSWFFWFSIIAGVVFIAYGMFASAMLYRYFTLDKYGYTTVPGSQGVIISTVDPDGPAAGKLAPGDRILAINGDPRFSRVTQFFWQGSFLQGENFSVRIARDGVEQEINIDNSLYPASQSARDSRLNRIIPYLPRYLAGLILALLIGLWKPMDKSARIVALTFLMISHQAIGYPLIPLKGMFSPLEDRMAYFFFFIQGAIWFGPITYHSSYRFQQEIPEGRLWSAIKWGLYALGGTLFLNRFIITAVAQTSRAIEFRSSYYQFERAFSQIENWYWIVCLLAISAVLIRNNHVVRQPDLRRRVKLVLYGSLVPVLFQTATALLSRLVIAAGNASLANSVLFDRLRLLSAIGLILTPIIWGYAILKRQVYDIPVVIRRSVQYLLARNALRLFLALPVLGVVYVVITKSDRSLRELLVYLVYDNPYYILLIIAAGLSLTYRNRLKDWIDRRFFREAYQQDRILRELSDEVRRLDSTSEMSRLVSLKVDEALHPKRLYLFYCEDEGRDLSLGYSTGGGGGEQLRIPQEYELLIVMEHYGKALDFPFPPKIRLPQKEKDWLSSMGISLIVPLNGADQRLAGLLLLGPKKSEEPYSGNDRQLLNRLADQIAVVYENARLKEQVARERKIQHEVLARVEERNINLLKECPRCGKCYDSSERICPDDQGELRLTLPVERLIEGRYRLNRLIGKGGMGAVYEAADTRLNRRVAVKILSGGLFGNSEALRRFQREAQASARLSHPNIVRVYDYGVLSTAGAYLVMELLSGKTLGEILQNRVYLEPEIVADWFDQVFAAIESAHDAGIVHRDLKPDNIFILDSLGSADRSVTGELASPVVKVLDFGIAKITQIDASTENTADSVTTPGAVLGTFGFMSPEQIMGGEIDQRSDIFSLGVIVVRTLTGRKPFVGKTYQELITAITTQHYRLPGDSPEIRRLDALLQRCLATDKNHRFASVKEMRREMIPALRQNSQLARGSAPHPGPEAAVTRKYGPGEENLET